MLIGVVLRGCAFTFRKYDALHDSSQRYYTWAFTIASVLTPLMLGDIAGAIFLGRVAPIGGGFHESYISPWFNLFSFSVGIFACVLFMFLAAVYLVREAHTEDLAKFFSERARTINFVAVVAGALVFVSAEIDGLKLAKLFLSDPITLSCMGLSTLLLFPIWLSLHRKHRIAPALAGLQVILILLGWLKLQFPVFLQTREAGDIVQLTIFNSAAPESTLRFLVYALVIGSAVIFPSLIFLLIIFKRQPAQSLK
jgi:cytochrome d ubiquinol oxidase subunit II